MSGMFFSGHGVVEYTLRPLADGQIGM